MISLQPHPAMSCCRRHGNAPWSTVVFALFWLTMIVGCGGRAGVIRDYYGSFRPPAKIAVVRIDPALVLLGSFGEVIGPAKFVEMAPGPVELSVQLTESSI